MKRIVSRSAADGPVRLLALVSTLALFGTAGDPASADLVAHWSMDRPFSDVLESDLTGLDGTLVNFTASPDKWIEGVLGEALLFDGIDDHVTHPLDLPREAGTIGHWLRSDDANNKIALYWSDYPAGATDYNGLGALGDVLEIHTGVLSSGQAIADYQDGDGLENTTGSGQWKAQGGSVTGWTHVAVTWERSGDLVLYVNCEEIARQPLSTGVFADHATSDLYIGRPSEAIRWWKGAIDEIRIYDEVLDGDAVRRVFCPTRLEEDATLSPDSPGNGDAFGFSMGLDGDTLVVGQVARPNGLDANAGSIQIFDRGAPGSPWSFVAERASANPYEGELFGNDVALSGDFAIATGGGENETDPLRAYVLERDSGGADNWGTTLTFTKDEDDTGTQLFVDIDGSTAAILSRSGFAYVYDRTGSWARSARLEPDGDSFGSSVAVSGDVLAVATITGVEIHRRGIGGANAWGLDKVVSAPGGVSFWASDGSLDLRGDTLVVGSRGENSLTGAVYVFSRHRGGTDQWGLVQRLEADDADPYDVLGRSISLASENAVVVGTIVQKADHGAAYLFVREGDGWSQRALLLDHARRGLVDEFGVSVAAEGESALVGASGAVLAQGRVSDYSLDGLAGWPLFLDGFESGDIAAWSAASP